MAVLKAFIFIVLGFSCVLSHEGRPRHHSWGNFHGSGHPHRHHGMALEPVELNEANRKEIAEMLSHPELASDHGIAALLNASHELVSYKLWTSHSGGGRLHSIVWKAENSRAPFICAKIIQHGRGAVMFRVATNRGVSIEAAHMACRRASTRWKGDSEGGTFAEMMEKARHSMNGHKEHHGAFKGHQTHHNSANTHHKDHEPLEKVDLKNDL